MRYEPLAFSLSSGLVHEFVRALRGQGQSMLHARRSHMTRRRMMRRHRAIAISMTSLEHRLLGGTCVTTSPAPSIPLVAPDTGELEQQYVVRAMQCGLVAPAGPNSTAIGSEVAQRFGARHAVALSSGLAALQLPLVSWGVGRVTLSQSRPSPSRPRSTRSFMCAPNRTSPTGMKRLAG